MVKKIGATVRPLISPYQWSNGVSERMGVHASDRTKTNTNNLKKIAPLIFGGIRQQKVILGDQTFYSPEGRSHQLALTCRRVGKQGLIVRILCLRALLNRKSFPFRSARTQSQQWGLEPHRHINLFFGRLVGLFLLPFSQQLLRNH